MARRAGLFRARWARLAPVTRPPFLSVRSPTAPAPSGADLEAPLRRLAESIDDDVVGRQAMLRLDVAAAALDMIG